MQEALQQRIEEKEKALRIARKVDSRNGRTQGQTECTRRKE